VKRNRHSEKRRRQVIQVWTHEQARRVLPYVASIMRSLREHRLQAQQAAREAQQLKDRPGRPKRAALIAQEEAERTGRTAEQLFQEALDELHTLDIYCLDPTRGLALIPFSRDNQLAWFVYELFDDEPLRYWRFHQDPLEARRPYTNEPDGPHGGVVI
jgi:hypothetical protein